MSPAEELSRYRAGCVAAARYWQPHEKNVSAGQHAANLDDLMSDRRELKCLCEAAGWDLGLVTDSILDAIEQSQHRPGLAVENYAGRQLGW